MDARLDPAKYAGLAEGDAHVIRNAGGRATDDAIRSLVISHKLLGTQEWFVIHHTNCGMEGGFKRSSQHLNEGGCDEHSKAPITPFWTGAVAVTGTAASSKAI
jgi:carbonic anhydrase